jgi:hypothetical protein
MVDDGPKLDKNRLFMEMFLGGKLAENLERMKDLPKIIDQQAKGAGETSESRAEKRKMSFAEKIEEGVRRDLEKLTEREDGDSGKTQDH